MRHYAAASSFPPARISSAAEGLGGPGGHHLLLLREGLLLGLARRHVLELLQRDGLQRQQLGLAQHLAAGRGIGDALGRSRSAEAEVQDVDRAIPGRIPWADRRRALQGAASHLRLPFSLYTSPARGSTSLVARSSCVRGRRGCGRPSAPRPGPVTGLGGRGLLRLDNRRRSGRVRRAASRLPPGSPAFVRGPAPRAGGACGWGEAPRGRGPGAPGPPWPPFPPRAPPAQPGSPPHPPPAAAADPAWPCAPRASFT